MANNLQIEQWTFSTVDQILPKGDPLSLDAGSITDTEIFSVNDLPAVARWFIETNSLNDMPVRAKTNDSLILG